ncbi:MAG: MerR family transcriptional regulator, partial [Firmicutes bacterium]|nr:MerR family transcriptional regulator [Bacillota bacterium]
MTIKEMEVLTGLTRANIRFYEQQGFLSPERHENGYRDYTEEDLEILKKIRLLRMLHVPLNQIHDMADGEQSLNEVLTRHLIYIDEEIQKFTEAKTMCEKILQDGKEYEEMNTELYLNELSGAAPPADVWDETGSGRRFMARMMDVYLALLIPLFLFKG